jgi:hypothetical protein
MDQATVKLLRQAAGYIKEGKQKAARTILVDLLRDDPEVDQAWYMLSFTVPIIDRQIYALEEALKVNPNNDKAMSRLLKLQGSEKDPIVEAFPQAEEPKLKQEEPVRPLHQSEEVQEEVSGDDLLSQRLLGEDEPEEAPQAEGELIEAPVLDETVTVETAEQIEEVEPEVEEKKEEKNTQKVFGIRRGIFLLVILILIFIGFASLQYSDQIKSYIADIQNGDIGNRDDVAAGDGDNGMGAADSTPEPTPTSGMDLPPVWTPTAPAQVDPTEQPDETQPGFGFTLVDFDQLLPPNAATIDEFDEIRAQVSAIMDDVDIPAIDGYIVTDTEIQEVLTEFARLDEYRDVAEQTGMLFVALGLSDNEEHTDNLMQNMWADPNGTLLFTDTGNVLISDFDESVYQKFSYAQSLAQSYRNGQISFEDVGIYPVCSILEQSCEVAYAITKGEAALYAEMWAEEYFSESETEEYLAEPVNWFTLPSDDPPLPFMEISLSLPYVYGKTLVDEIFKLDRLDAVDDLYDDLPTTTEQLMHLEKYLAHEEAVEIDNVDISEALGVSWQKIYNGTLGEWKTYLLMAHGVDLDAQLSDNQALAAAAGWGGDYGQVYYRLSTQDFVVVVEWAWDSDAEAVEFSNSFETHLQNQSGANPLDIYEETTCYEGGGQVDCIFSDGNNVVWLQAPDQSTITLILGQFGFGT